MASLIPELQGQHVKLKPVRPCDAYILSRFVSEDTDFAGALARAEELAHQNADGTHSNFGVWNNTLVGIISLQYLGSEARMGFNVKEPSRDRRYTRDALDTAVGYAWNRADRVVTHAAKRSTGSRKLLAELGFEQDGIENGLVVYKKEKQ